MAIRHCGLYARVSTVRQAVVQDGSLDNQFERMHAFIQFKNTGNKSDAWEITQMYREEGFSGKDMDRPELQRLLEDIRSGKIDTVIVYKIDRITRSLRDFYELWDHLTKHNVEFVSLNEHFDTSMAIGRAVLKLVLIFAELEREQTSERTRSTMEHRATQGLWNGGRVFGYSLNPERKGVLLKNPEEAKIVHKLVFEKFIELGSIGKVQRLLLERGIRMPQYESRRGVLRGGNPFSKQDVSAMLRNPVYIGKIRYKGEHYDGQHETIIPDNLWNHVQEKITLVRKTRSNFRQECDHIYLLKGLLKCGQCGSSMTPKSGSNGKGQIYAYYQCTRNSRFGEGECNARYVPAGAIEDLIVDRLRQISVDDAIIEEIILRANGKLLQELEKFEEEEKEVQRRVLDIQRKIDGIVNAIESGGAKTLHSLSQRLQKLEDEQKLVEEQCVIIGFKRGEAEAQTLSGEVMARAFRSLADILKTASPAELAEILPLMVDGIEWHEDADKKAGSGHFKMALFENPFLRMKPKQLQGRLTGVFAECQDWLPR